jgi:hypothetical protein
MLIVISACNLFGNVGQNSMYPARKLTLEIDIDQRAVLFENMQKFADKHSFRYVFTDQPASKGFSLELWGESILIAANDVPPDPNLVYIYFYKGYPGSSLADEDAVNKLANELNEFLSEIPNVTITEEK